MKTINEIINDYTEYETFLDDRFGVRFCSFLSNEQAEQIGFKFKDGYVNEPKEWTEKNILEQLKEDVEFGYMKAVDERGISSELMAMVVNAWCKVLQNGLNLDGNDGWYHKEQFTTVAEHYGWKLENYDE